LEFEICIPETLANESGKDNTINDKLIQGGNMEKQEYQDMLKNILGSMTFALDDVKRCLNSLDKQCLAGAENEFKEMLVAALPLVNKVVAQPEKTELEKKLLTLVPSLQKIAQAVETILIRTKTKCGSAILFTEKGMNELTQVVSGVRDLARDTSDVFATGNPHLKRTLKTEMERVFQMADDFALEHQERFVLGLCTPLASYLYVDMLEALKRIARELAYLSEKG
jgi:Na+/phosphate symporter